MEHLMLIALFFDPFCTPIVQPVHAPTMEVGVREGTPNEDPIEYLIYVCDDEPEKEKA